MPTRRNFAHLTDAERQAYVNAVRQADLRSYPDGVSYWDKQDQIHQGTHNHGGPSFVPWHRELCNRYERLLQAVDPSVALHYWDWTQNPRQAADGSGGTVDLTTDTLFGTANGVIAGTLAPLHNGGVLAGSRDATGNPADPPAAIRRNCSLGSPPVAADATILAAGSGAAQAQQWPAFRAAVESSHNSAHGYFGAGSSIGNPHTSFEDPFVYLLHSNVDRLFAMWQTEPGQEYRLDPALVYGVESVGTAEGEIQHPLQPWDGTVEFGAPIPPWTPGSGEVEVKDCRHPSVVAPPCYDTLPLTVTQVTPAAGQPLRFIGIPAGQQTARALRLRVRGCRAVTAAASLAGDPAFGLLAPSVALPDPAAYITRDLLVWVLFTAGAAGSTATGTLTVTVPETAQTVTVPIEATVVAKPTVASCLVLDRSGSMDQPSGLPGLTRMAVLRSAAPLFVNLLDDDDAVGVVRFDTDAAPGTPVQVAGGQIAGAGRTAALGAIQTHTTNPLGLTAIGDGLEAGTAALNAVSGFASTATVVFTDGEETASKRIDDVLTLINSRVFAIGLGTADQLDPVALQRLVNGTGGYLLLTGNPGPDDQIRLQKYFAQVLAGVTNADIVVDPDGHVPVGREVVVPYDLTEAETRHDVVLFGPTADVIDLALEAPDGTLLTAGAGFDEVRAADHHIARAALAGVAQPQGRWLAHLTVDQARLHRHLDQLEEAKDVAAIAVIRAHGVPFTLSVQARSSLHLQVQVTQGSRRPGSTATVTAALTEAGIPLGRSAAVRAHVVDPLGTPSVLTLVETDDGLFRADLTASVPGVYQLRVRAEGTTLRGSPFTREELRTVAVWDGGDRTPDPGGTDLCGLLRCWLADDRVRALLQRNELDPDTLARCLDGTCPVPAG
jgi:hypothetical protein